MNSRIMLPKTMLNFSFQKKMMSQCFDMQNAEIFHKLIVSYDKVSKN